MNKLLTKYWIEFDSLDSSWRSVGITAYTEEDAINIIKEYLKNDTLPEIIDLQSNINLNELDQNHVIPNMSEPYFRGIWYPKIG